MPTFTQVSGAPGGVEYATLDDYLRVCDTPGAMLGR